MTGEFPIVAKLGGRDAVRTELEKRGLLKSKDAMRMWVARRRIPGDALAAMVGLAAERGVPLQESDIRLENGAA